MLYVIKHLAVASLTALLISCASTQSSLQTVEQPTDPSREADSLEVTAYDDYFLELYGEILEKLDLMEKEEKENARLIEARSIVKIAEAVYLEGNTILAIKLLNEAGLLLRLTP